MKKIFLFSLLPVFLLGLPNPLEDRLELDLERPKNTTTERKVDSRNLKQEVYPRSEQDNSQPHMSPPNVTHKLYCVNGYVFVLITVYYGWNPDIGKAVKIETHFQQQFDKHGRGIPCQ